MKKTSDNDEFAYQIKCLFESIFRYYLKKRPVCSKKKIATANFYSFAYKKANQFPLLRLFKTQMISEDLIHTLDIRVKAGPDKCINSTDIDWLILDTLDEPDAFYVLVTRGQVDEETNKRLFEAFAKHQVLIVMIGDRDIDKLWKWVYLGNMHACIVSLFMPFLSVLNYKDREYTYDIGTVLGRDRRLFIEKIMDGFGYLEGFQLRTLVNKLSFLISFTMERWDIKSTCRVARISRKTFYNWCDNDPVFKDMVNGYWIPERHKNLSYQNSRWFIKEQRKRETEQTLKELWDEFNSKNYTRNPLVK